MQEEIGTVITDEGAQHHYEPIDALQQADVELIIARRAHTAACVLPVLLVS
jgi:hypothetical protein